MSQIYENTDQKIGSQRRYVATAVIICKNNSTVKKSYSNETS